MQPISDFLPDVYRKLAGEAADEEALLLALWPQVAGEKLSARTRALRVHRGVLMVETSGQDWRKQLSQMSGEIVRRLNGAAGKPLLRDVQFLVAVRSAPRPLHRATAAGGAEKDEAAGIADPHLRRMYRISRRRRTKQK